MRILFLAVLLAATPALAHEQWSDGKAVPPWVKSSCCGPEDVHHLAAAEVHAMADGWHIDGYRYVLPYGRELPSQDGEYWVFYKNLPEGLQSAVFCFFAPVQSY